MLSQAITALGLDCVAWAGPFGQEHYRMTTAYNEDLAVLSSWAHNSNELLHLAIGWQRAHYALSKDQADGPSALALTIVVNECPPKFWDSLHQVQRQGWPLLVILMDEQQKYLSSAAHHHEHGLSDYAASLGIYCSEPAECHLLSSISQCLHSCLNNKGSVRLAHLIGSNASTPPSTLFGSQFSWNNFSPGPYNFPAKELPGLEAAALLRIANELLSTPSAVALWTRSVHPGPLLKLGQRLQYCSISGLAWQIAGLVSQHCHPVVFLPSVSIPLLLPELMGLEGCPVTFIILDGCCSFYTSTGKRQPLAKLHDLALLSSMPDLVLAEPADEEEARALTAALLRWPGLSAVKLMTVPALSVPSTYQTPPLNIGEGRCLRQGQDLAFICLGPHVNVALLAIETLRSWGFQAGVYDMRFLQPLDRTLLSEALSAQRIITVEDHSIRGGLGSKIADIITASGMSSQIRQFIKVGLDQDFLECDPEDHGISINSLLQAAQHALELT